MTTPFKIFDTVDAFVRDGIPQIVAARKRTDVVPVYMDVPEPEAGPSGEPRSAGNVTIFPANGQALVQLLGIAALGLDELSAAAVYRKTFGHDQSPHPIDVCFNRFRIFPDAFGIVFAGNVEWSNGLLATRKLRSRLPGGDVAVLSCTCVKADKIARLRECGGDSRVHSLIFTEDCMGGETLHNIADAFLATQSAPQS